MAKERGPPSISPTSLRIGPSRGAASPAPLPEGAEPSVTRVMMIDQDDWFHVYDIPGSRLQRPVRGV